MDQKFLFLINREWTNPALDKVMAAASSFSVWTPLLIILVVVLLIRGDFRMRAFILTAAMVVGFNDGVLARVAKKTIERPRPEQFHHEFGYVRMVEMGKARPRALALFKPVKVKD